VYEVSRNSYNSWRRRGDCLRKQEDSELLSRINSIFLKHDGCYGSPKITHELRKQGVNIGQKRVARIMREHEFKAVKAHRYRTKKYDVGFLKASPCGIAKLTPTAPNQL
jgi:putative transposase